MKTPRTGAMKPAEPENTTSATKASAEVRVQIDVPQEFAEEIDRLAEICGFKTRRETTITALSTLMWVTEEIVAGRRVGSLDVTSIQFRELAPLTAKLIPQVRKNREAAQAAQEQYHEHMAPAHA